MYACKQTTIAWFATILTLALMSMALYAYAADQMKSTDVLVYSATSAVTGNVDAPFSIYLGDTIVASAVKSFSIAIGGVYTGGGTLAVSLDSDPATTQTFTLPTVTAPTPFQVNYRDPSGKVNPATAGSYSYTLNMNPTGVTIYNLSAVASETHRYTPTACADGSGEKIKTQEFLAAQYTAAVSSVQTSSFSFYLGDDFTGVSSPVKSAHFVVHGVYTGSGSIKIKLDSDLATEQTYALPNVGTTPTFFEFIYKDPTNSVNHTSNGTWTHSITSEPSGVIIYDHGILFVETHRYKPPGCGGLPPTGELYSAVFDTGSTNGAAYNSIMWTGTAGTGKVRFQLATSDCANGASNPPTCSPAGWSFKGGTTCTSADWFGTGETIAPNAPLDLHRSGCLASLNGKRYFRYAVQLCANTNCTSPGATSPTVSDVVVSYSP